nr:MAG TPA: hypothetical protein [Caudoviricetes sp.]
MTLVYKYGITLSQRNNAFYFFKRYVNFGLQKWNKEDFL